MKNYLINKLTIVPALVLFVFVLGCTDLEEMRSYLVANAGDDQIVVEGVTVTLDASGSTDSLPNRSLTYIWSKGTAVLSTNESFDKVFSVGLHEIKLTVVAEDASGSIEQAYDTVSIGVSQLENNNRPVAISQSDLMVAEDGSLDITLAGTDADGNSLSYRVVDSNPAKPASGTLTGTAPNLVYTPNANFNGTDEFFFVVSDGVLDSLPARVQINISAVNDAPVASPQNVNVDENASKTIALVASDVDGDALSYSVSNPSHGALSGTAPNLTYTPTADYNGRDSFTFTVNDLTVDSEVATVGISVIHVEVPDPNLSPVAHAGFDENALINTTVTLDGTKSTDPDGDNNALTYLWGFSIKPDGSSVTLSSAATKYPTFVADKEGEYVIQLVVSDGSSDSQTDTVKITITPVLISWCDAERGEELWKTNGTELGTQIVKDIYSGDLDSRPETITYFNGIAYFSAESGASGKELWKSDGTEAGTVLVKDILAGDQGSDAAKLLTNSGALYFRAKDGTHGYELWKSDGTTTGTEMVKDINASGDSYPSNMVTLNGKLYFKAKDGTHGYELWESDGTNSGTKLLKDINDGADHSDINDLTTVDGALFFKAKEGSNGVELWTSNGTTGGTRRVKDIYAGAGSSYPNYITGVDGVTFFTANDNIHGVELWKSNGTEEGTVMVKNIKPVDGETDLSSNPGSLTEFDGNLFFVVDDGTHGVELWKSDGTTDGTVMLKDIVSGSDGSYPDKLTVVNGTLFFTAKGNELWKTEGTEASTVLIKSLSEDNPFFHDFVNLNGVLYFKIITNNNHREELWKSDGSSDGTVPVKEGCVRAY